MNINNIPYVSIKSVLYDLNTLIQEADWDETKMLEWATKALRKGSFHSKYEQVVKIIPVIQHTTSLPKDLKYITQIAYKDCFDQKDLEYFKCITNLENVKDNPALNHMENPLGIPLKAVEAWWGHANNNWHPLRLNPNSFALSVHCNDTIPDCPTCGQSYTVSTDMSITTTFSDGLIAVSYLRYPQTDDGDSLIPDNENLKEAILHFIMYRIYMVRGLMKEEGSMRERDWHLNRYGILMQKAIGELNMPSLDEMENIKDMSNRLVPRSYRYDQFFGNLNARESHNFSVPTYHRRHYRR